MSVYAQLEPVASNEADPRHPETELTFRVSGGQTIPLPEDALPDRLAQPPTIVRKTLGHGTLLVVLGADVFSHIHMGPVFSNPDADQRKLYRLQYALINQLLK